MMTDISFSPSSFYNFETDSSSSHVSSSLTNHSYVLQPQQTRNLESLLVILDSHENFKELMGLLDGWKNHSGRVQQASPEPLPILPPFQSPSPPPPPVPIPGTPEGLINVDAGTRESPIEVLDDPGSVNGGSDEEFPFWGRTSPSVVNDWEGRVDWNAAR